MIRFLQKDSRFTKSVFIVIIGAACATLVISLVPGIFTDATTSSGTYATIRAANPVARLFGGSSTVATADVQAMAQRMLQRQQLPDFVLPYMMQQVGQRMIQQQVSLVEADKLGLQVSDEAVRKFLHTGPLGAALFPGGVYVGDQQYAQLVSSNFGISREKFEGEIKKELEEQRLQDLVTGAATVSDAEVAASYKESATKIKFDYAVISADDISKGINPSDAELQDFFKKNASRYATAIPETRKIQYFAFTAANVPGGSPQVSDDEAKKYYDGHTQEFHVDDQVRVRHILIKVDPAGGAAADAAAKAKAQGILDQLHKGGDFAKLAEANSDDPGSKAQGGELGMLKRAQTVPEFDAAAFSLPVGQISPLVKTKFGYHIIEVEEKQTSHTKPFDEVKLDIKARLIENKLQGEQQSFAHDLAAEAGKQGMDKTAAAHHLTVETTDYVQQDGTIPALADSAKLLQTAFATKKGSSPDVASTGDGYAVFVVLDTKAAHAPDFAAYKDHILTDFRQERTPQVLATKTNELAAKAKAEGDLAKAAKEEGAAFKTSDLVGKSGQVPDVGELASAAPQLFTMSVGQMSGAINTGRTGVVAKLVDKQEPTADDVAKNLDATRAQMLDESKNEAFAVFVTSLYDQYKKQGRIVMNKAAAQPAGAPGAPAGPAQPGQ